MASNDRVSGISKRAGTREEDGACAPWNVEAGDPDLEELDCTRVEVSVRVRGHVERPAHVGIEAYRHRNADKSRTSHAPAHPRIWGRRKKKRQTTHLR